MCCVLSLATLDTATGGRCGSWVARKASGVRADGGSKFCAIFRVPVFGATTPLLACIIGLGGSHLLSRWELPHSLVGAGGPRMDVDVERRKEAT